MAHPLRGAGVCCLPCSILSLIESIEDEVLKLDVEFGDRIKKESGTK